jgi:parvulin-like peptidyl-prolyl isomerase
MFIAHGDKVRKHARWIMGGILVLLIPGFIMLFTNTSGRERGNNNRDLPSINGKPIDASTYQQVFDDIRAEVVISTGRAPGHSAAEEDRFKQQAVVRIVLLNKANELGLRVTDSELQSHIQSQPVFANDAGQFDPRKYTQVMQYLANNFSISPGRFEDLTRQQILVNRLQRLVATGAKATPEQVTLAYAPLAERVTVNLVEFSTTNTPLPSVTEAEAKTAFGRDQESFRIPTRVQVRYALFSLAEAKKAVKITDGEIAKYFELNQTRFTDEKGNSQPLAAVTNQIRELLTDSRTDEKAGNDATFFAIKLVQDSAAPKPDFVNLAELAGATISQTGFFTQQGPVEGLEVPPAFRQAAFSLTAEAPYSDPIPSGAGYYVLQYLATKPSEIPPFDQVKDKVITRLQQVHRTDATMKLGQDALTKLRQTIAPGTNFDAACATLNIRPRKFGPFAVSDDKAELPGGMYAREAILSLATNSLSELIRIPNGVMFMHLQDRQPPAAMTNVQEIANVANLVLRQNQQALFNDWLKSTIEQEKVEFGRLRSAAPTAPTDEIPEE